MQAGGRPTEVDWSRFDPWKIQPFRHRLAEHPLLQVDALLEFCKRYERAGRIRSHSNDAEAGTPFYEAPRRHPHRMAAAQTLADIERAKAWMALLNVQNDEIYRGVVDEVLDDVKPGVEAKDPGMCFRAGWIFVSSPHTTTPFHMDKEHNFLMQIQGYKRVSVWPADDTETVPEIVRDRLHGSYDRELMQWREEARSRAQVFDLQPGMGVYMPSTSPHLVETGSGASITMSFTYYTRSTRRRAALHALHQRLRERGWEPPPVGAHPALDGVAYAVWRAATGTMQWFGRFSGHQALSDNAPYAHASPY